MGSVTFTETTRGRASLSLVQTKWKILRKPRCIENYRLVSIVEYFTVWCA